jgi:hypothetical protein
VPWIGAEAIAMLRAHGWPGNVRELENVIRRALLLAEGLGGEASGEIRPEHIRFDSVAKLVEEPAIVVETMPEPAIPASHAGRKLANIVQVSEAKAILETLAACGAAASPRRASWAFRNAPCAIGLRPCVKPDAGGRRRRRPQMSSIGGIGASGGSAWGGAGLREIMQLRAQIIENHKYCNRFIRRRPSRCNRRAAIRAALPTNCMTPCNR